MPRKQRTPKGRHADASPYLRLWLALGIPPCERVHGWVNALITFGRDNLPFEALRAKYGAGIRDECQDAGFEPACDVPLAKQTPAARAAAAVWERRVLAEGRY